MTAIGGIALLYGFVVTIDPWDALPLSPALPRVPISSNARFSFPALARSPAFDSAVLGTSTARLLQPAALDLGFGAHFVNLAMNAATGYEQSRLFDVFLRWHPAPRVVIVSIDDSWCSETYQELTGRPFPAWMYGPDRWSAYREMLTPYAVQEAWNQFMVMIGLKRRRYGLDGYTRFVPPDSEYDRARRDAAFRRWAPVDRSAAPAGPAHFPTLKLLDGILASLPPVTRKILFFSPYEIEEQGPAGSRTAWRWAQCKQAVASLARRHGAEALDFMIPSDITRDRDNYWDPLHYREAIAARITEGLVRGASPDAVVLFAPRPEDAAAR